MKINSDHLIFEKEKITNKSFKNLKIGQLVSIECQFIQCDFSNTKIRNACFGSGLATSEYIQCKFDGSSIFSPTPGHSKFIDCSFINTNIKNFYAHSVEFLNCKFSGKISKSFFNGSYTNEKGIKVKNLFQDNDFSNVIFTDVGFRSGIDLFAQSLPEKNNYWLIKDAQKFIEKVKAYKISNPKIDQKIETIINILELEAADEQNQLYLSKDDFPKSISTEITFLIDDFLASTK